ncbi:MAG: DUF1684 domain-containing protein [Pseudomonadota bacterium]
MNINVSPRAQRIAVYAGPEHLALADWRRRVNALYAKVRGIESGREAWMYWHQTRSALFKHHPMSPLPVEARSDFETIPVFEYDPSLRCEVETKPVHGPDQKVDVGADGTLSRRPIFRTLGLYERFGAELTVYWISGYGGGLFLPFTDASSGLQTYGGGRYLLDAIKGADLGQTEHGDLILDFNFAYNPSCALNDAYVCPLAPAENRLPQAILGGERLN